MVQRNFFLGDEWVYLKYYGGPVLVEEFLVSHIVPFVTNEIQNGVVKKWFFIRYYENGYHLRIRFLLKDLASYSHILTSLNKIAKPFTDENLIWKIQGDTYKREIERYGSDTIELAEDFFFADSNFITKLLIELKGRADRENLRWLCALRIINIQLDVFEYSSKEKVEILENFKFSFLSQIANDKKFSKQLSKKFRMHRNQITSFLGNQFGSGDEIGILMDNYQARISKIVNAVKSNYRLESTAYKLRVFNISMIHMTMNRLFRSKPNLNETVCYDLLSQFIKSHVAREKRLSS